MSQPPNFLPDDYRTILSMQARILKFFRENVVNKQPPHIRQQIMRELREKVISQQPPHIQAKYRSLLSRGHQHAETKKDGEHLLAEW